MTSRRSRFHTDEEGSVTLLTGVAMVALVGATALAVDVGRLAWSDREAQSTADLVALDAVRAVGDLRDPSRSAESHAVALADGALQRNAGFLEENGATPALDVVLGTFDPDTRTFTPGTHGANAVQVETRATVSHAVVPGSREVTRQAIAMVQHLGGVQVGGVLASAQIDAQQTQVLNAVLAGLLGEPVTLDAVGYRGLADAHVSFGELVAELGFGTPQEAATATVGLGQLLDATATVLSRSGVAVDAAAATPVQQLRHSVDTETVDLGELFTVGPGRSAADAELNVLGMVLASIEVANGTNAAAATVPVAVPGVSTAQAVVSFVETPRIAIGPARQRADGSYATVAHSAQGRAYLTLVVPDGVTFPTPLGPVTADLTVPLYVELGRATAHLTDVTCTTGAAPDQLSVLGVTSGAAAWVGTVDPTTIGGQNGVVSVSSATFVDVAGMVRVSGTAATSLPGGSAALTFTEPFTTTQRIHGGSPDLGPGLADGLNLTVDAVGVGIDTAAVRDAVLARVDDVLRDIDTTVLDDLAGALGVSTADADVAGLLATCDDRTLVR